MGNSFVKKKNRKKNANSSCSRKNRKSSMKQPTRGREKLWHLKKSTVKWLRKSKPIVLLCTLSVLGIFIYRTNEYRTYFHSIFFYLFLLLRCCDFIYMAGVLVHRGVYIDTTDKLWPVHIMVFVREE